jgi:hypothetical protein
MIQPGHRYRYSPRGEVRSHRGLIGVASNVERLTATTSTCTLSNLAEWEPLGIKTQILALSTELEPAPLPAPTKSTKSKPDAFEGQESELVADITKALKEQGYLVCVVGQYKAKGSGTTVGYPDMSIRRRTWPRGLTCLLEVKTASGALSPEQETLHADGWSYEARSVAEAVSALTRFESEVWGC